MRVGIKLLNGTNLSVCLSRKYDHRARIRNRCLLSDSALCRVDANSSFLGHLHCQI